MATPAEKLASSLEVLKKFQSSKGVAVIKSKDISRTHRDRLVANGFIREVIKGWYISMRPDEKKGDSTSWFTSFWHFIPAYCNERFGRDWFLTPEQSLAIHIGNFSVPKQLLVRSPKGKNNKIVLIHGTSLFDMASAMPHEDSIIQKGGLNLYTVPAALISTSPGYFSRNPTDARTALLMVKDSSDILGMLLEGGRSLVAGRLAGAFRNVGRGRIADDIIGAMKSAGYDIRESDPFSDVAPHIITTRGTSPYVNRIVLMWQQMRNTIIDNFPESSGLPRNAAAYLKQVDEIYVNDAYNSLSIEGYRVTPEIIEKVRTGNWKPDTDALDKEYRDAMGARGYWQAFQVVKNSINDVLKGKNPGLVARNDHSKWYRELFAPSVTAGLLKASDLAGYRKDQVYIKGSKHIPLNPDAVRDAMPAFFGLLKEEKNPGVRAVLGHFVFVYIHPYMDGNGRIARFLMNIMLAAGGYAWTVIPIQKRNEYMNALERASVDQDILLFSRFIAKLVQSSGKRFKSK
ncbi:MAG TPA: Fic family protein [Spirochaetota bacterium]|nr:Fic family protein [Spirochaetota bacterium]HPV43769.1 Fic family protein [Spirochaetota bacterium]